MIFLWTGLAIVAGVAVALQAQVTGIISGEIGWIGNVFIAYVVGLVVSIILVVFFGKLGPMDYFRGLPSWYHFSAGVYGVIIVGTIGICSYKLGVVPTLVIIFVSQVIVGKVISHYGLLGTPVVRLSVMEIMAFVLLIGGTSLLLYGK